MAISSESIFVMESGSFLTGGANGVAVVFGATFIMNGGEIYGNDRGVLVCFANSHFQKNGGMIFGNVEGEKHNGIYAIEVTGNNLGVGIPWEILAYRAEVL